jgi:hypothetical protein
MIYKGHCGVFQASVGFLIKKNINKTEKDLHTFEVIKPFFIVFIHKNVFQLTYADETGFFCRLQTENFLLPVILLFI